MPKWAPDEACRLRLATLKRNLERPVRGAFRREEGAINLDRICHPDHGQTSHTAAAE
jgi:hypothetical protein